MLGVSQSPSVGLSGLVLLIVVVLLSCVLATWLALCTLRSWRTQSYLYCSPCSTQVGLPVNPRPWVELLDHNVPHNSGHVPISQREESGTFQRLGMKSGGGSADSNLPVLTVAQLQTAPMSSPQPVLLGGGQRHQIISPSSAEVLARRDTARSQLSRMSSRRTLQFKSPVEENRLTVPRQVRRSVAERRERTSRKQEEGVPSQSEDERGSSSTQTVIRKTSASRIAAVKEPKHNNKLRGSVAITTCFDNPVYESASVEDRSTSFYSPPDPQITASRPSTIINQRQRMRI